ncbi:cell division protein FtsL [Holzapfeliella sp. JNUCC 80]
MADSPLREHSYDYDRVKQPANFKMKTQSQQNQTNKKQSVKHTASEKMMLLGLGITGFVAMIALVFTSVLSTQAQQHLQSVNSSITQAQNKNIDLQQDIGELTNNQKLASVAQQNQLQLIEGNIRNIQK